MKRRRFATEAVALDDPPARQVDHLGCDQLDELHAGALWRPQPQHHVGDHHQSVVAVRRVPRLGGVDDLADLGRQHERRPDRRGQRPARPQHHPPQAEGQQQGVLAGLAAAFFLVLGAPIIPVAVGTEGHLLGGTLAVALLGPWLGPVVITVVTVVQALFLGDGGLSTLGINVVNLALVPAAVGYPVLPDHLFLWGWGMLCGSVIILVLCQVAFSRLEGKFAERL